MKALTTTLILVCLSLGLWVVYDYRAENERHVEVESIAIGRAALKLDILGIRMREQSIDQLPTGQPIEVLTQLTKQYGDLGDLRQDGGNPLPEFLLPGKYEIPNQPANVDRPSDPILLFTPNLPWEKTKAFMFILRRDGHVTRLNDFVGGRDPE